MKVSRRFIKEYVDSFYGFGGQINKQDLVNGDFTILDTNLTANGIGAIKEGSYEGRGFMILIANGHGWGTAWLYEDGVRQMEDDMYREIEEESCL